MDVDTISRGTGKRDQRIANPGLNWAYFGSSLAKGNAVSYGTD